MLSIQGTLRLTSPLHITAFESSWRLNDDRQAIQGDKGGKPLNRIARQTIVDKDNVVSQMPFFCGNGFRGSLRRFAAKRVIGAVGPVPMDIYHGLMCGAVSGRPAKDSVTISGTERARNNVYLGLFGGGPALQRSRYRAPSAVPVTEATIGIGMVPDTYSEIIPMRRYGSETRPARPDELLFYLDFNRVDDAKTFRDPDASASIDEYENSLASWLEKINDNKEAVAANKEASKEAVAANKGKTGKDRVVVEKVSKSGIEAMAAVEVLAPGVHLFFRIDLDEAADDAQAGLMMLCVADLVRQNRLGGWGRLGLGTFAADLSVFEDGERLSPLLQQDDGTFRVHADLETFETAAHDALAALDVDTLRDLFKEE